MGRLESPSTATVSPLDDDADFLAFLANGARGLQFVPESPSTDQKPRLKSGFGDFFKWMRELSPEIQVSVPAGAQKIVLRSADIWLPLVYLAGDTSVQIFLNMAASYLYDRAKGALRNERPQIHLSVAYEDKNSGKAKRFDFSGDAEALGKAIKRFDLNNFFDDAP